MIKACRGSVWFQSATRVGGNPTSSAQTREVVVLFPAAAPAEIKADHEKRMGLKKVDWFDAAVPDTTLKYRQPLK